MHYTIEGRTYQLEPYDMVLVRHNEIHRPVVDTTTPYERIIFTSLPLLLKTTVHRTTTWDIVFKKQQKRESSVLRIPTRQKVFCFRQSKDWKNPFPLMAMPTNSTGKFFFRIYDSSQSRGARKTAFLFGYRRLQRKNSGHSALYQCQFVRPSFN